MEIAARPAVGAVWTPLGPGVGAPSPTIATGVHGDFEVELTLTVQPSPDGLTGQMVCSTLITRQRPGGPPVTSVGLRALAVAQLVRQAADQVVGPNPARGDLTRLPPGEFMITDVIDTPTGRASGTWGFTGTAVGVREASPSIEGEASHRGLAGSGSSEPQPSQRVMIGAIDASRVRAQGPTDDNLRLVAGIYQRALAARGRPTVAVQTALGLPRSTAGDWIRLARERGFLAGARRGRPRTRGEAIGTSDTRVDISV